MDLIDRVEDVRLGDVLTVERDGIILTGVVNAYSPNHTIIDGVKVYNAPKLVVYQFNPVVGVDVNVLASVLVNDGHGQFLPNGERFISATRVAGTSAIQYL